jgi:hypothetical protein
MGDVVVGRARGVALAHEIEEKWGAEQQGDDCRDKQAQVMTAAIGHVSRKPPPAQQHPAYPQEIP